MIGVIRVFTTDNQEILNNHGEIITSQFHVPTVNACIPDQKLGIYDQETEDIAVPKIVELGKKLEQEGCELVVISCAADPGVNELRKEVSIPVIGAGSAAALIALSTGKPVGILGITENPPKVMTDLFGDLLVAYKVPEGVSNTTDLLKPEGKERGMDAVKYLLDQGAEVVVFACTGFSTIGLADMIRKELKVPIIDAVESEGLLANQLLQSMGQAVSLR